MGFFLVLKAEWVRGFIIMRRYWFATLTGLVMGYGMLISMVFAYIYNKEDIVEWADRASSATSGILGLIIGMFAFSIVGMFSQGLAGMARSGQLEQLYMSPHGLITNFLARTFVSSVSSIISSTIMLLLIANSLSGQQMYFYPLETLVLLVLTYMNLIGFGFMVGGLVLVFKQIGQVTIMIRLVMTGLALIATDKIENWHWTIRSLAHFFPVTDAAICLKYVLINNQMKMVGDTEVFQSVFTHSSFYFILVSCIIWNVAGLSFFKLMENWSRDKGTLGAY